MITVRGPQGLDFSGQSLPVKSSSQALVKYTPSATALIASDQMAIATASNHLPAVISQRSFRMLLTEAMVSNPQQLRYITMEASKYSEEALGRVFVETAAFYPDKLEDVLKYAAEQDYYRMKHVVNRVYYEAGQRGIEVQSFPTAAATQAVVLNSAKQILRAGVLGIPMEAAFKIFDYHSGDINATQFAAKSLNGFFSWGAFEAGIIGATAIGSSILGKKMGPLGSMVWGVGTGIVASSLYHKTIGPTVEKQLEKAIPEEVAKPLAKGLDKYFATPIQNYVVDPIKSHPKTALAIGGLLATALTIRYPVAFGRNFLLGMAGATAIGVAGNVALNQVLPQNKTPLTPPTMDELAWAMNLEEQYRNDSSSVSEGDALKYQDILSRYEDSNQRHP